MGAVPGSVCALALAIVGQHGHFALIVVKAGPELPDFAPFMMQLCLPFRRQHSGKSDSAAGSKSGNTTSQVNNADRRIAMLRRTKKQCSREQCKVSPRSTLPTQTGRQYRHAVHEILGGFSRRV
jgi:hypothetical protein